MQWVFFDCFNTLVDDFDAEGAIDGLETIAHLPVEAGLFESEAAFRSAYRAARQYNWWQTDSEVHFDVRLHAVFCRSGGMDAATATVLVKQMLEVFAATYPASLRLTREVEPMLQRWSKVANLAVVSNFFLPGWPQQVLAEFGLGQYFQFVIDSAAVGAKKPEPGIYQAALAQAAVAPAEVLFIGDDYERDVLMPRQLGMQARHVCRWADRPGVVASPDADAIRHWDDFQPGRSTGVA
jgi:HAD superfamily hydrolase (TIGR01549 family)